MAVSFRAFLVLLSVFAAIPSRGADLADSGIGIVPEDAAFVSASLRLREQYDRLVASNAFAAVSKLPAVRRAIDSIEEQRLQPGNPLSILSTFMELPENQQALELVQDMVATDTVLYGEPSCVTFVELMLKLQQAQQSANILQMARGDVNLGGINLEALDGIEVDEMEEDEEEDDEDEDDEDDDEKNAAAARPVPLRPVRFQAIDEEVSNEELTARIILQTLVDNRDRIVVPDLVWVFKTTKLAAAESQLKRIEVLIKLMAQANPDLARSLVRKKIAGAEFVTFTVDGGSLPWEDMTREATEGLDGEALDSVLERLRTLDLVLALGIVDDRVILSIGDSADHLEKLVGPGGKGLLETPALAPVRAHMALASNKDKPLTAISHLSQRMATVLAASADDIEQLAAMSDKIADAADLPEEAAEEARRMLSKAATGYKKRLPVPGPWTAYSFLAEQGYEGYAWDWSKNLPIDGSKRLDLLEHTGGAPLGAVVFRTKADPQQLDDYSSWAEMGWGFFKKYLLVKASDDAREKVEEVDEHLAPLAERLVGILRTKLLPALADGQIGLVLDAKSRVQRLQKDLPAAAEPLPLVEPAIVLGIDDPKLFREGMSDVFALTDELVDAVRDLNPDALPAEYRVADPVKSKVEGGAVWSFAMPQSGVDEQVQPSIGVGDKVAVFSLVPKQAGRILVGSKLDTGAQLSRFEEPLAVAAALDFAGIVDAVQPWIVYSTRLACLQQRDGEVDASATLTAEVENPLAKDALQQTAVVCEALKSLRAAVAETSTTPEATVTHWRNVIRDMPAPSK
jgi:hypothetical protein